jgi:hypothetical protein
MPVGQFLDVLSKRAPVVAAFAFASSLIGKWTYAPAWLFNVSAIFVGCLTLVLLATRGLSRQFKSKEEQGFRRNRDWIAYGLAVKGMPRGYRRFVLLGFVTIVLSGIQLAYGKLAITGWALVGAWGIVNRRYPADLNNADL